MTKNEFTDILEQHVEKIVLGLAVLVLLIVGAVWGLGRRQTVELSPGRAVPPAEVDQVLAADARRLDDRAANAPVPDLPAPRIEVETRLAGRPWRPVLERVPGFGEGRLGEDIDMPDAPDRLTVQALASALPAPTRPQVRATRHLRRAEEARDVVASHVAAVYPLADLRTQLRQQLRFAATQAQEPVIAAITLEVQEQTGRGAWSQPRPVQTVRMPLPMDGMQPGLRLADLRVDETTDPNMVQQALQQFASPERQQRILQPEYWPIWISEGRGWGDWKVNLPRTALSQREIERIRLAGQDLTVRVEGVVAGRPITGPITGPGPGTRPGGFGRYEEDFYYDEFGGPPAPTRPTQPRPAAQPDEPILPEVTPVPQWREQLDEGQLLVWAHDASLEPGRTYRYRLRVEIINPLLGHAGEFENAQDAYQVTIASPWSEWSEPVSVDYPTRFFLTGDNRANEQAFVTVFTYELGQVVQQRFPVRPGQVIGGGQRVRVFNPITAQTEDRTGNFATESIVVRLDFDRRIQARVGQRTTTEMYYLDGRGQLVTRIRAQDEANPDFDRLSKQAALTRQLAENGGATAGM